MAMDFPNSPTVGQVFSSGSRQWVWTGTTWDSPAAGTPGIVSSTGGTFTGDITAPNYAGRGNAIINGAFDIWQRGTSFNAPDSLGTRLADRFLINKNGSGGTTTVTRQTFTPGQAPVAGYESAFFLRYAQTVASSGQTFHDLLQAVEDVRTLAGQTVTFSFWAKGSSDEIVLPIIQQIFGSGGSATVPVVGSNISLTTSWARYTYTVALPSISGKTIGDSSFLQVSLRLQNNRALQIDTWGWQIEAGTLATPFRRNANSLQGELAACQRYYWRGQTGSIFAYYGVGLAESATIGIAFVQPPVAMRSTPSLSLDFSSLATYDGTTIRGITALTISQATTTGLALQATVASGQTANRPLFLINNNTAAGFLGISAEL